MSPFPSCSTSLPGGSKCRVKLCLQFSLAQQVNLQVHSATWKLCLVHLHFATQVYLEVRSAALNCALNCVSISNSLIMQVHSATWKLCLVHLHFATQVYLEVQSAVLNCFPIPFCSTSLPGGSKYRI